MKLRGMLQTWAASWFFIAVGGLVLCTGAMSAAASDADGRAMPHNKPYAAIAIMGDYAFTAVGEGGNIGPEAVFGVIRFNEDGQFKGQLQTNTGPSKGMRTVVETAVKGSYVVNADGRGTLFATPLGDFAIVVTKTNQDKGDRMIATEVSFVMNSLSASGNVIRGALGRRINKGIYTSAGLDGNYGFVSYGRDGMAPAIALGAVNFNADMGIIGGDFTVNLPTPALGGRMLFNFFSEGPFSVNEDGSGSILSTTTGLRSRFVVTKARMEKGIKIAEEIFWVPEGVDPAGNFSPAIMTRRFEKMR